MIQRFIGKLLAWLEGWLRPPKPKAQARFTSVAVEDIPSRLEQDRVYLAGGSNNYWMAAMLCPCGCGDTLHLNLLNSHRPHWKVNVHTDNSVSFHPSLWRKTRCKSHFFLKRGFVQGARTNL